MLAPVERRLGKFVMMMMMMMMMLMMKAEAAPDKNRPN